MYFTQHEVIGVFRFGPQTLSPTKHCDSGSAQVDSVYFPQHEVVGDIGNGIWQLKERLKESPLPEWDLRCAALLLLLLRCPPSIAAEALHPHQSLLHKPCAMHGLPEASALLRVWWQMVCLCCQKP